jgi:hypothetical protein
MWKISKSKVNRSTIFTTPKPACCNGLNGCTAEKTMHDTFPKTIWKKAEDFLRKSGLIGPECCDCPPPEPLPPTPVYEWYRLTDCASSTIRYSVAYAQGSFEVGATVIDPLGFVYTILSIETALPESAIPVTITIVDPSLCTPPPTSMEWYQLTPCFGGTALYSVAYEEGTYTLGQQVYDSYGYSYTIAAVLGTDPLTPSPVSIVGVDYTSCPIPEVTVDYFSGTTNGLNTLETPDANGMVPFAVLARVNIGTPTAIPFCSFGWLAVFSNAFANTPYAKIQCYYTTTPTFSVANPSVPANLINPNMNIGNGNGIFYHPLQAGMNYFWIAVVHVDSAYNYAAQICPYLNSTILGISVNEMVIGYPGGGLQTTYYPTVTSTGTYQIACSPACSPTGPATIQSATYTRYSGYADGSAILQTTFNGIPYDVMAVVGLIEMTICGNTPVAWNSTKFSMLGPSASCAYTAGGTAEVITVQTATNAPGSWANQAAQCDRLLQYGQGTSGMLGNLDPAKPYMWVILANPSSTPNSFVSCACSTDPSTLEIDILKLTTVNQTNVPVINALGNLAIMCP